MSDYFTPDVLTNIFAKLPIKTLFQCTLVCQSWHSFIKSQDFIMAHAKWKKPNDLFYIRSHTITPKIAETTHALYFYNEGITKYADIHFPFRRVYNYYRIVGTCDGVLCLAGNLYHKYKIILWNPTIRTWLRLPCLPVSLKDRFFNCITGFGFDSNSEVKDYKVVRITYYRDVSVSDEVYVYSLSSGIWRKVSHSKPKIYYIGADASQAYINGALHWIASDVGSERNFIVKFDLSIETFLTLELPGNVSYFSPHILNLMLRPAVIEDSLALVESKEQEYCTWLMEQYGVSSSWIRKINVVTKTMVDRENQFVMGGDYKRGLYKLGIRSICNGYRSPRRQCKSLCVESYRESLVLLGMQENVEGNEIDSEETTSSEEETESSVDDTEYGSSDSEIDYESEDEIMEIEGEEEEIMEIEGGEEEILEIEGEEEETESRSSDQEFEREDERVKRVVTPGEVQTGQADNERQYNLK